MKTVTTLLALTLLVNACSKRPTYRPSFSGNKTVSGDGAEEEVVLSGFTVAAIETDTIHRLNRFEYNNTIQDLLAMPLSPADAFPTDPVTHGFDNVGANLSLSPALTDLINQASEIVAKTAVNEYPRTQLEINPVKAAGGKNGNAIGSAWSVAGELPMAFNLEQDESLTFALLAGGKAINAPTPKMTLKIDGKDVQTSEVKAEALSPDTFTVNADLTKGAHTFSVRFDNQVALDPFTGNGSQLVLTSLSITSKEKVATEKTKQLVLCAKETDKDSCKLNIVLKFAERAWRRPLTKTEKTDVTALWKSLIAAKATDEESMKTVIQAITLSSKFLFRTVEPQTTKAGKATLIDDYSLANRLSYFLWSSMPDDELMEAAANGDLRSDEGLKSQMKRMLLDPKAQRLVKGFAAQWLGTRNLDRVERDTAVFKTFSGELKTSMANESELLFKDFLTNSRPINDFLSPGYAFLDDRLAAHYGLPVPNSTTPTKVKLSNAQRGGILTQASWLTITSLPGDTLPVKRGAWILENLLCKSVPAPPAVPPLAPPEAGKEKEQTVRERFEAHLSSPSCRSCHSFIDPIGFGMEAYDAVGAWRTLDSAGRPVDTKGSLLVTTAPFDDAEGMANLIRDGKDFQKCVTKKLYSYAIGRTHTSNDESYLEAIESRLEEGKGSLGELVELIILSPAFRMANFSESL